MFGTEIKERRRSRQQSLADISSITGIDRGLLSKLETGTRKPTIGQIRLLANALDLSDEVLMVESGILPPDVNASIETLAPEITASARQISEPHATIPSSPGKNIAHILAESVEREVKSVKGVVEGNLLGSKVSTAYRAHSYHTKVPPETITPFIEHFTNPGDVVLDPFCGSGMTGVAALETGRHAILSDLSPAAVHIAHNYTSPCSVEKITSTLAEIRQKLRPTMSWLYEIKLADQSTERTEYITWSDVYSCPHCNEEWTFWDAARDESGAIIGKNFPCPSCSRSVRKDQCEWRGECPVEANLSVEKPGSRRIVRVPNKADLALISISVSKPIPYWLPEVKFGQWREMWRASHRVMGIDSATDFYSKRNLHALAALRHSIMDIKNDRIKEVLLFAFTAISNRASRRYQWNVKRPTNVMSGTLYVSSLRYEWNVWSLFERKAKAIIQYYSKFPQTKSFVDTTMADATNLCHVPDASIDFVYMDPPFGANIFYADVSLLWEAWLGCETNLEQEIVVNKHLKGGDSGKSIDDYQQLMTKAFSEVRRVLKPQSHAVLVFSNTDDKVWGSIQTALKESGFNVDSIGILDKGQRSIKGVQADLGKQQVTRLDLVLTLSSKSDSHTKISHLAPANLDSLVRQILEENSPKGMTLDRLYSHVLEKIILSESSVAGISMSEIEEVCRKNSTKSEDGYWRPFSKLDYIDVDSPYGCLVDEYLDFPKTLTENPTSNPKRVTKPLTEAIAGTRNTAFYNAHSYMTKVPPESITPFIEHYTKKGDVVLDMFAGSGMTGVAAYLAGRNAIMGDISVMSAHLSFNHSRPCDSKKLVKCFEEFYEELLPLFRDIYKVPGNKNSPDGYAHYTLWSERYACPNCTKIFSLYDAIDSISGKVGPLVACPSCGEMLKRNRLRSVGSEPALVNYVMHGSGSKGRHERIPIRADCKHIASFSREMIEDWFPRVPLGPERDMFNISALHLKGINEVADFYTPRNLFALSKLFSMIQKVKDKRIRQVFNFAYTNTAWHGTRMRRFNARGGQRPLTGTLYIPQISSEVNVLEVMRNKIKQLAKYYDQLPETNSVSPPIVTLGSAGRLSSIPDNSIDYIFIDPPFGSNIFYADCNLINESWLGGITKVVDEAVVNRTISVDEGGKTVVEYQELLANAFLEACRVLKPLGWMTVVFHNTNSEIWQAIQAASIGAGFEMKGAGSLDRKEMSHKGYKGRSGNEKVAHFDIVMSLRKTKRGSKSISRKPAPIEYINEKVAMLVKSAPEKGKLQWIHSELIQAFVTDGHDLGSANYSDISEMVSGV